MFMNPEKCIIFFHKIIKKHKYKISIKYTKLMNAIIIHL